MFTVTDEDRQLRAEGKAWRKRCKDNLVQNTDQFEYQDLPNNDDDREHQILTSSLGAVLQERTALIRRIFREGRVQVSKQRSVRVRVLVSQRAIEEAMAEIGLTEKSEQSIRELIYRFISTDFQVNNLHIDWYGRGTSLAAVGHRYTDFYLIIPIAD